MKKQKNKQAKKASKLAKAENLKNKANKIITVKNAEGDPDTTAEIVIQNKIDYEPKVSVIIPVYNVEQYLRECLDSVVNQTLKEIEIICVDDGSTDSSLEILKEYAKKDNRITVMKQENLHAGVARNAGLAVAKGEYVHFLDSDDWVCTDGLKKIVAQINNSCADMIKFKNKCFDNISNLFINDNYTEMASVPKELFGHVWDINNTIQLIKLPDCPWSGVYRRKFIETNCIRFDKLKCANDVSFFISSVINAKVFVSSEYLVNYRVNNGASLVGVRAENFYCQTELYHIVSKRISLQPFDIQREIKARILYALSCRINNYIDSDLALGVKRDIYSCCKKFFDNLDISFLPHGEKTIYDYLEILYIRELMKRSSSLEEYFKLKEDDELKHYIFNYISVSNIDGKFDIANPKISVIIPIYNTEKYIGECLDSVLSQSLKDIEVICIDDGSSDSSYDIIKSRSNKDKRIKIIRQKNLGSAVAKNKGLFLARGEFVAFMDADDLYPDENVLSTLYNEAIRNKVNICGGCLRQFRGEREVINEPWFEREYIFDKKKLWKYSDYQYDYGFTRFIYNNNFLKKFNLYFPEYLRGEDPPFFIKAMCLAKNFYALPIDCYYYRILHKSVNWTANMVAEVIVSYNECLNLSRNFGVNKLYQRVISRLSGAFVNRIKTFSDNEIVIDAIKQIAKQSDIPQFYTDFTTNNPKVSVIIPVYNVEKYLSECLDSIINQTLKDIEIICVNDGSPDNSLKILEEYAKKDSRIIIINQHNQGLSCSRNNALKIAKGEYIQFLDSDDWLKENALELLYKKCKDNNVDMLNFAGINYNNETHEYTQLNGQKILYCSQNIDVFSRNELLSFMYSIPISACRFFYRRRFLIDNQIVFPERINFEDNYFVRKALIFVNTYAVERETLYFRRVHGGSITNNIDVFFGDYIKVVSKIADLYDENKIGTNITKGVIQSYVNYMSDVFDKFEIATKQRYYKDFITFFLSMHKRYGIDNIKYTKDLLQKIKKGELYVDELKSWYKKVMKQELNLDNPQTFNEKIQWLKLYDSTPLKTRLADKYLVRDWIKEKIGEEYLIPLLGVYDKFEEIDFDKLPNKFVIKCNHGSGWNIIVKDKTNLDLTEVKAKLDKWMTENFAFKWGVELHYRDIQPKIIIEEYMDDGTGDLMDYKYTCFNGKPEFIWIDSDRHTQHKRNLYDLNWKQLPCKVNSNYATFASPKKPECLDEMTQLASILSEGFPYVRVDFYVIDNKVYFGEMTFTSSSGTEDIKPESFDKYLTKMIKLPKLAYNIDTGEYYKLPKQQKKTKPSLLKSYLLLPYYLLKIQHMKRVLDKKPSRLFSISKYGNKKVYRILGFKLSLKKQKRKFLYDKVKTDTYTKTYICGICVKKKPANVFNFIDSRVCNLSNQLSREINKQTQLIENKLKLIETKQVDLTNNIKKEMDNIAILQNNLEAKVKADVLSVTEANLYELNKINEEISTNKEKLVALEDLISNTNQQINEAIVSSINANSDNILRLQSVVKSGGEDITSEISALYKEQSSQLQSLKEQVQSNRESIVAKLDDNETWMQEFKEDILQKYQEQDYSTLLQSSVDQLQLLKEQAQSNRENIVAKLDSNNTNVLEFKKDILNKYQELNYADLLHDSIINCEWLKNKSFSLYGWAANYSFIYTLFRILDKAMPHSILEMGLGQTTRLTTQYVANKDNGANLMVCEHDKNWIDIYCHELAKSDNIQLNHCELEYFDYDGKQNDKYKNMLQIVGDKKFDLIIVDGPVGGGKNLPRSNIIDLIPNNLAEDFVIIIDDSEREGEQKTIAKIKQKLNECNIKYSVSERRALKGQTIIMSTSREFVKFL